MSESLSQLPLEILHAVLHHVDIPDIVRLRRVSRYLNQVCHSRDVWSYFYRTAPYVHPPGPFISQSARDLEDALVPSFRADRNLGRRGDPVKLREIRYTGSEIGVSLVYAQFLVIAFKTEVRCYDLNIDAFDSNSCASIIFRPSAGSILKCFRCVSAIDVDGRRFACVVLIEELQSETKTKLMSIYSLSVGERHEVSLDLLHQFEHEFFAIDCVNLGPRVLVIQGRDNHMGSGWCFVAIDVPARTQLLLPRFTEVSRQETETPERPFIAMHPRPVSISTSTHLIVAQSFTTAQTGWDTFFQAFTFPHPTHAASTQFSNTVTLGPSHAGFVRGTRIYDTLLLHDAVQCDASTQDVLITIIGHASRPPHYNTTFSRSGILRLHNASTALQGKDGLGTITFCPLDSIAYPRPISSRLPCPCRNGTWRVVRTCMGGGISLAEYDVRSGDGDAAMAVRRSMLRFPIPRTLLDYDPYSGRICLRIEGAAKYNAIEILDYAV